MAAAEAAESVVCGLVIQCLAKPLSDLDLICFTLRSKLSTTNSRLSSSFAEVARVVLLDRCPTLVCLTVPLPACSAPVCLSSAMSSLTSVDIHKMKVADLKTALKERGLDASGVKADLIARLEQHINTKPNTVATPAPAAALGKSPSSHGTTQHRAAEATAAPTAAAALPAAATATAPSAATSLASPPAAAPIVASASSAVLPGTAAPASSSSSSSSASSSAVDAELAARQRRAEKFGTAVQPLSDEHKRKLRTERFGPVELPTDNKKQKTATNTPLPTAAAATATTTATTPPASTAAAAKPKAQNGQQKAAAPAVAAVADPAEEEKRKARAARFAQTAA